MAIFDTLIDIVRDVWTGYSGTGKLRVDASGSTFTGTVTGDQGAPNSVANAWPVKITDGVDTANVTAAGALQTDGSGVTQPISAASLPLPLGASTSALQTAGNASLASIDTKTPSLGQALAAASVPVVLTALQLATLTPLTTVTVTQGTSPWVVSGTVTFSNTSIAVTNAGVFAVQSAQSGAWTVAATQSGAWSTGRTWTLASGTDSVAAVQSGTWNIGTVTTVSTITNLSQLNGAAISMNTGVRDAGTQRVTIATNDSVPVTGTFFQATQPVSLATLPALVAGTAIIGKVGIDQTTPGTTNRVDATIAAGQTLATVTTVSTVTNLAQLGGAAISMNTGVRDAGTQRVTIATNDSVPVTGTVASGASATAAGTSVNRQTALTNTAVAIKASAGNLYGYHFSNQANPAQDLYVHLYNVAAGSVTVGTTTPSRSYFLPAGAVLDTPLSVPAAFSTAMSYAVSTTATGGTAPTNAIYAHVEFL